MPDGADKPAAPRGVISASSQLIERKLATILSADVAEFSRLMSEDEEQTLRLFRGHKKIFEALVATHHGRVFNTAGDAILAEFASAVEAVRCATDVQSALRTRNDAFPPSRQVRFRIGVNLGDVMIQGQDLLGDGVNLAARLQTAAEPGGICISGSVHDQIRNKLSLAFHSLGERNYKNIPQPVRTFAISESEGGIVLPSAKPHAAWKHPAIWAVAGVLLAAGVGYGAYALFQHGKLPNATPTGSSSAMPASPTVGFESPAPVIPAMVPPPAPEVVPQSTGSAPAPVAHKVDAKPARASTPPAKQAAPASEATPSLAPSKSDTQPAAGPSPRSAAAPSNSPALIEVEPAPEPAAPVTHVRKGARPAGGSDATAGTFDGVYAGQVCYEKVAALPHHCYRASGNVNGNKISGRWLIEQGPLTMFMEGRVARNGDVTIQMHSDQPDGTRVATINLAGSIRNGTILAAGKFLRGRAASIDWQLQR
ncbi:MAG TPA: adenylate/guanylate cyclase domain-containing protein [Candidatus Acidoferrales bacterium]|nr:adenylate/guanylate cyclase domain-containing protein [Candidatus Acidoferrales bacterium]